MTTPAILVTVKGVPHAQPRPRFVAGMVRPVYKAEVKFWIDRLTSAFRELHYLSWDTAEHGELSQDNIPLWARFGLVELEVEFRMPVAYKGRAPMSRISQARLARPHGLKPDLDNLVKLLLDRMQDAGLLADDRRVTRVIASKVWSHPREAGMTCQLRRWNEGIFDPPLPPKRSSTPPSPNPGPSPEEPEP